MPWRLIGNSLCRASGWRTAREVSVGLSWRGSVLSGFFSRVRSCCSCVFGPCMNASFNGRLSASDCGCDANRVRRRRLTPSNADHSWFRTDDRDAAEIFPDDCGFRARRLARRCVPYSDVYSAWLAVLLVALVGSVLFDVSLATLLGQVLSLRCFAVILDVALWIAIGTHIVRVAAGRRNRRRFCHVSTFRSDR